MELFKTLDDAYKIGAGSIMALGNFDGVHLGHQEIIKSALAIRASRISQGPNEVHSSNINSQIKQCKERGAMPINIGERRVDDAKNGNWYKTDGYRKAGVLTLFPHPASIFKKDFKYIMSLEDRIAKLAELGLDFTMVLEFTPEFAQITASSFIEDILINQLKVSKILTGSNFRFGYRREGTTALLSKYASEGYFDYTMIDVIQYDHSEASSSIIKDALAQARLRRANELLGAPFHITGVAQERNKQAKHLSMYPDKNMALPKSGVYLVKVSLQNEKKSMLGIANLGLWPIFKIYNEAQASTANVSQLLDNNEFLTEGQNPLLEVHMLDFSGDIYDYDATLKIEFLVFIRPEYKFTNLEKLKAQIILDIKACRYLMRNN